MAESQARRLMGAWAGEILPELGGGGALGYNCATPGAGKEVHPVPRGEESKNHCPQHLVGVTHIF